MHLLAVVVEVVVARVGHNAQVEVLGAHAVEGGAELQGGDGGGDAGLGQVGLEHGGEGLGGAGAHQDLAHVHAVGVARLGEQLLGLGQVVGVGDGALGGGGLGVVGVDIEVGDGAQALVGGHVHGVAVHGIGDGLADQVVFQNLVGLVVDAQEVDVVGLHLRRLKLAGALDLLPAGEGDLEHGVHLAVLQGDDGGGVVHDDLVVDVLDGGGALPVVLEGPQGPAGVGVVGGLVPVVGAGAGQVGLGAELRALGGDLLLAEDFDLKEGVQDGGVGAVEGDAHVAVVHGLDVGEHVGVAVVLGVAHKVVVAEDHVAGLEGLAVVELHAGLEGDVVYQAVVADVDLLGQQHFVAAAHLVQGVQALVDLLVDGELVGLVGVGGVGGLHGDLGAQVDGVAGRGAALAAAVSAGGGVGVPSAAGQQACEHNRRKK